MKAEQLEALLRLFAVPGIGSSRLRALVGHFRSPATVLAASKQELMQANGIDEKCAHSVANADNCEFAQRQLRAVESTGAQAVTFWDAEYPAALKTIYDPPAVLFVRGSFSESDRHAIAIVGTRKPTNYGRAATQKLTVELVQRGLTIVSGLAYGIDTIAHANAVNNAGRTIAVLGSGIDRIYPAQNTRLADRICEAGAVISEFPMGTGPDRTNFPRRNRIICGLALGVVVVEAGEKSGALITAMNALDQNREVFAVPGNIDSSKSVGPNELIQQGAKCTTCVDDIIEELAVPLATLLERGDKRQPRAALDTEESRIMALLSEDAIHIDALSKLANEASGALLSTLLSLELKDVVRQLPGKMFVKI